MGKKFIDDVEDAIDKYSHSGVYKTIENVERKTMGWSVPVLGWAIRNVKKLVDRLLARD